MRQDIFFWTRRPRRKRAAGFAKHSTSASSGESSRPGGGTGIEIEGDRIRELAPDTRPRRTALRGKDRHAWRHCRGYVSCPKHPAARTDGPSARRVLATWRDSVHVGHIQVDRRMTGSGGVYNGWLSIGALVITAQPDLVRKARAPRRVTLRAISLDHLSCFRDRLGGLSPGADVRAVQIVWQAIERKGSELVETLAGHPSRRRRAT